MKSSSTSCSDHQIRQNGETSRNWHFFQMLVLNLRSILVLVFGVLRTWMSWMPRLWFSEALYSCEFDHLTESHRMHRLWRGLGFWKLDSHRRNNEPGLYVCSRHNQCNDSHLFQKFLWRNDLGGTSTCGHVRLQPFSSTCLQGGMVLLANSCSH